MDAETTPVTFSVEELWLLQDAIRHEAPNEEEEWKRPPTSLSLNTDIAYALVACHKHSLSEYTLMLSAGDCLAIDWTMAQDAKTPEGGDGRIILLKSFEARRRLDGLDDEEEMDLSSTDYSYQEVKNAYQESNKKNNQDISRRPNKARTHTDPFFS